MDKAKEYSVTKYKLAILEIIFNLGFLTLILFSGASSLIQQISLDLAGNGFLAISFYIFILGLIYYLVDFPLNFYGSFVIEHKFRLTKQKFPDWAKDQAKTLVLGFIFGNILIQTLYFLINSFPDTWWLITALAWIFFSFVFAKIFPVLIIPLFFKYKPVAESQLKTRILNLAQKFKIRLLDVFEIDFSKKTLKANAAFVGFGKGKRVILADTLEEKYSDDEIEAILAHEFAHFKLKHLWKLFFISSLATAVIFYLIFKSSPAILELFGIYSLGEVSTLPLFLIYMTLFEIVVDPLVNFISRFFEKEADLLAVRQAANPQAFCSMMEKLASQNLADKNPNPWIKFFFFDHPPIEERLNYVKNLAKN